MLINYYFLFIFFIFLILLFYPFIYFLPKEARKHVNRICLAANKPVIESGTAGYLGQVQVIYKDHFECYECRPLPKTKTYAYCTIHNTPSKPIHCIIWAKIKFTDHFCITENTQDEEEDLANDSGRYPSIHYFPRFTIIA